MAAVLKLWGQIENPTSSIDAYLLEEHPTKFRPDRIWNDGALCCVHSSYTVRQRKVIAAEITFSGRGRSNKKKNNNPCNDLSVVLRRFRKCLCIIIIIIKNL